MFCGQIFQVTVEQRELSDLLAEGPPSLEVLSELGKRYGLQFGNPDWLPDFIARYGHTPLPGYQPVEILREDDLALYSSILVCVTNSDGDRP
jgi:hypothetical protein